MRVTVLYPCLNEEAAIGECVDRALAAIRAADLDGEVLVIDNASTDRSAEIAAQHGARVVSEPRRGYGSAYLRGFAEARGDAIVILDADGTYPVEMTGDFVRLLESGADFVCGNRFGGLMEPGAMPWMNQHIGNPILSGMTRLLFALKLRDIHCGMRGIRREVLPRLKLHTIGMEFATEMIVKAVDNDLRVVEVSIPYRPRVGESKLMPFRDAWRHVEYMLVFSPSLLFLWPGAALALGGFLTQVVLVSGPTHVFFRTWDVHTNLAGLTAALVGTTLLVLGLVSSAFASTLGMAFGHSPLARLAANLGDRPLRFVGGAMTALGTVTWLAIVLRWAFSGFAALDAVPVLALGTSLLACGLEIVAAAFLVHLIRVQRA